MEERNEGQKGFNPEDEGFDPKEWGIIRRREDVGADAAKVEELMKKIEGEDRPGNEGSEATSQERGPAAVTETQPKEE